MHNWRCRSDAGRLWRPGFRSRGTAACLGCGWSESYADARGNERSDIENLLRIYFLRQQKIALLTSIEQITVYADTAAKIELTVGMAGINDSVLGLSADAYRFELELEKDADEWLLISARWGELGEEMR